MADISEEKVSTQEEMIDYMTMACGYAGIAVTPTKVAILMKLYDEISVKRGNITLSEIRTIRETIDVDLKVIEKVKKKRTSPKIQKQGERDESWIEKNIKPIVSKLPPVSEYRNFNAKTNI